MHAFLYTFHNECTYQLTTTINVIPIAVEYTRFYFQSTMNVVLFSVHNTLASISSLLVMSSNSQYTIHALLYPGHNERGTIFSGQYTRYSCVQ